MNFPLMESDDFGYIQGGNVIITEPLILTPYPSAPAL